MRPGTVVAIKQDSNTGGKDLKLSNRSNYLYVQHEDGTVAEYAHFAKDGALAIQAAQRARGLDTEANAWRRLRGLVPLVAPTILGAVAEAEELVKKRRAQADKGSLSKLEQGARACRNGVPRVRRERIRRPPRCARDDVGDRYCGGFIQQPGRTGAKNLAGESAGQ